MKIFNKLSLRAKIFSIISINLFISLSGGFTTIWYTYKMDNIVSYIINKKLEGYETVAGLEFSLINQKGFVSYYFQDRNLDWLEQLDQYRELFLKYLKQAETITINKQEDEIINQIKKEYNSYITFKDLVIQYYKIRKYDKGSEIHYKIRNSFFEILKLCKIFKKIHRERIEKEKKQSVARAEKIRNIAIIAITFSGIFYFLLITILIVQVLSPIQRLAEEVNKKKSKKNTKNEVSSLRHNIRGLIEDIDQNKEYMLQSEKMVQVGKLAAGMAHSIRNPLTSVKMRLFSLSRSLDMSDIQRDDFQVISEEINHIDDLVQNFLEFSRPPKPDMKKISPSHMIDQVMLLLKHRLKAYNVKTKIFRKKQLPEIYIDIDQLKEVFVNIIINACEVMENKGMISIYEEYHSNFPCKYIVIRVLDTGPGILDTEIKKIFEPFFTTKEDGSGLGLSIAMRIITEHHGKIDVVSKENEGTEFIITLPVKE